MAFTAINADETREVISVLDPAIDKENSDLIAYREHYDQKHLVIREDAEPTVFTLRHIPLREANKIKDSFTRFSVPTDSDDMNDRAETAVALNQAYTEACRWGVVGWAGVRDADGNEVKARTYKRASGSKSYDVLTDAALGQLSAWGVVGELGRLLIAFTDLTEEESGN